MGGRRALLVECGVLCTAVGRGIYLASWEPCFDLEASSWLSFVSDLEVEHVVYVFRINVREQRVAPGRPAGRAFDPSALCDMLTDMDVRSDVI